MSNKNFHKARKAKNDEFFTQLSDIENELKNYKRHFKNKTVYLNCDNPDWSNFVKYFDLNFEFLGLKKLIVTHYEAEKQAYKAIKTSNDGKLAKTKLKGNGDFRSEECLELLKEADIVVTNPPFSLFREFVGQLDEYKKKFLIVGNMNAISYKETFKLINDNKMWLGVTAPKLFVQPDGTEKKFGNISWFTNLNHRKRNEELILFRKYNKEDYPTYDNYKAIEVSKTVNIPMDYEGVMGVPISFLTKYNPDQFEIVTGINGGSKRCDIHGNELTDGKQGFITGIGGKAKYFRIFIKNKKVGK